MEITGISSVVNNVLNNKETDRVMTKTNSWKEDKGIYFGIKL